MNTFVLVLVLLYGDGSAHINVGKPMTYQACSVLQSQIMLPSSDHFLNSLGGEEYNLKWAVCREVDLQD